MDEQSGDRWEQGRKAGTHSRQHVVLNNWLQILLTSFWTPLRTLLINPVGHLTCGTPSQWTHTPVLHASPLPVAGTLHYPIDDMCELLQMVFMSLHRQHMQPPADGIWISAAGSKILDWEKAYIHQGTILGKINKVLLAPGLALWDRKKALIPKTSPPRGNKRMEWEYPQKRFQRLPDSLARLNGEGLSLPKLYHLKLSTQWNEKKKKVLKRMKKVYRTFEAKANE